MQHLRHLIWSIVNAPSLLLCRMFTSDLWSAPTVYKRDYVRYTLKYLREHYSARGKHDISFAIDLGCGNGVVARNFPVDLWICVDANQGTLNLAKFLCRCSPGRNNIIFVHHDFLDFEITRDAELIVALNVLHNYDWRVCGDFITRTAARLSCSGVFVLDLPKGPIYKYHHSVEQISELLSETFSICEKSVSQTRTIVFIEKLQ